MQFLGIYSQPKEGQKCPEHIACRVQGVAVAGGGLCELALVETFVALLNDAQDGDDEDGEAEDEGHEWDDDVLVVRRRHCRTCSKGSPLLVIGQRS